MVHACQQQIIIVLLANFQLPVLVPKHLLDITLIQMVNHKPVATLLIVIYVVVILIVFCVIQANIWVMIFHAMIQLVVILGQNIAIAQLQLTTIT
jgi:hypothetical protein